MEATLAERGSLPADADEAATAELAALLAAAGEPLLLILVQVVTPGAVDAPPIGTPRHRRTFWQSTRCPARTGMRSPPGCRG